MEFRQLEYFKLLCEELHFTRTAEKLGITQPTLSHQIKALEDDIGVPLFDRIGKRIAVTEAGSILYKQCSNVFGLLQGAREEISELQRMERGSLSIGALPGELNHLASSLLVQFHRSYPGIRIKLHSIEDSVERILANELDLAITILPQEDDRLRKQTLYHENFYFVCRSDHPLASQESLNLTDIQKQPIVMFPETHHCRQLIDGVSVSAGLLMEPLIETASIESLFNLIRSGTGSSILSKTLIEMQNDPELKAIPIDHPSLRREVGIITHKDKYIGKAAKGFIELLTDYVCGLKSASPV
ncbi:LysR family transcriptional regulator [Paenibacillus sp. NPDC058174]|uniref:LysR family transcriptional regulator n=1 Tax=Paenibacillus sp. NPDC058174 TaxID=3346366 RepID=UPI0036DD9BD2